MTSLGDLRAKWEARRSDPLCAASTIPMELVCAEILADLAALADANADTVTLREASELSGYSVDHLGRLLAEGRIENVGRHHRPRIRRGDVPRKPGYLPQPGDRGHFSDRRRIVASVATRSEGTAS